MLKVFQSLRRKDGIALIAVLGFLGVLLVMAIAFVATMRTERVASETTRHDIGTRIFLKGCVYSSIDDINNTLWGNSANRDIRLSKSMAVLASQGTGGTLGPNTGLLVGEVTNWIQRNYLYAADPDFDIAVRASNAKWIAITDPVPGKPHKGIIGRFAYVAIDGSGLFDANLIATSTVRSVGTSIGEISDIVDITDPVSIRGNRARYHRFATLPEIILLNDGNADPLGVEKSAVSAPDLDDLVPYSLCYDNGWWDWSASAWKTNDFNAPTDIRAWSQTDANNVFSGLHYPNASDMALCFQDYVDADNLPGVSGAGSPNVNIPCCEAIPMINEITVSNKLEVTTQGGTNYFVHTLRIEVETWYPFPGNTNTDSYVVRLDAAPINFSPALLQPAIVPGTASAPFVPDSAAPFKVATFNFASPAVDATLIAQSSLGAPSFRGYDIALVDQTLGNKVVDRVVGPNDSSHDIRPPPLKFTGPFPEGSTGPVAIAVNDPRMNHDPTEWVKAAATLRTNNFDMVNYNISAANTNREGEDMYVRNSTNLQSVAELGFISTGDRWATIDMFSPEGRDLLAKFRTSQTPMRYYTNGFVNPNTLNSNVLQAIFKGAPIDRFPGELPPYFGYSDKNMWTNIVGEMIGTGYGAATGKFDSAGAWVTIPSMRNGAITNSNNEKDALIRNTYRLFNPNQNLLTIIVMAQTINDVNNNDKYDAGVDEITGEKRAVVVVWRDPFPSPGLANYHESEIRLFRYLDE